MKIDKAIEILHWENTQFPKGANPDFTDALELGIEALKVRQEFIEKYGIENYIFITRETQ